MANDYILKPPYGKQRGYTIDPAPREVMSTYFAHGEMYVGFEAYSKAMDERRPELKVTTEMMDAILLGLRNTPV